MSSALFKLSIAFLIVACQSTAGKKSSSALENLINEKIGNATIEYNTVRDFALACESGSENASGIRQFLIIRVRDLKIIEQGIFRPGYIRWYNAYEVEILDLPGALPENEAIDRFKKIISLKPNNNL